MLSKIPDIGKSYQVVLVVKKLPANAGDARNTGSVLGLGRSPREGNGYPLQYSCLGKSHRQRSLADYSPWGRKESDMKLATKHQQWHLLSSCLQTRALCKLAFHRGKGINCIICWFLYNKYSLYSQFQATDHLTTREASPKAGCQINLQQRWIYLGLLKVPK